MKQKNQRPCVVSTVACAADLSALPRVMTQSSHPDILELRLDLLDDLLESALETITHLDPQPPILLTARCGNEGGAGELPPEIRTTLILKFLPSASLIDIEIRSIETEQWDAVLAEARSRNPAPLIVGSFHDFEATPPSDVLRRAVDRGAAAGVDIVKIATRLASRNDLRRLESLLDSPPIPLAVMGMGEEFGEESRIRLARAGSVLNYGFTAEQTAPGQWQANKLVERLRDRGD